MAKKPLIHLEPKDFEKVCEKHLRNNKKIKALFNFSECKDLKGLSLLRTANEEYKRGLLDEVDEKYLEQKLNKHEINANDWCYKTKWVKKQIKKSTRIEPIQLDLDFG